MVLTRHARSTTSVFLALFREPKISSTKQSRQCMDLFGKEVVEFAVLSIMGSNPREAFAVLSNFDEHAFEHLRPNPEKKPEAKNDSLKLKQGDRPKENEAESVMFMPGDKVTVHGLKKYEGEKATIMRWNPKVSKYAVKLSRSGGKFAVRASFLKTDVPPSQSASSSSDDDVPPLIGRANRSDSSSSEDDSSSSNDPPPLTNKDTSSSDDEDIPPLRVQESSSDDSDGDSSREGRRVWQMSQIGRGRGGRKRSEKSGRGRRKK